MTKVIAISTIDQARRSFIFNAVHASLEPDKMYKIMETSTNMAKDIRLTDVQWWPVKPDRSPRSSPEISWAIMMAPVRNTEIAADAMNAADLSFISDHQPCFCCVGDYGPH